MYLASSISKIKGVSMSLHLNNSLTFCRYNANLYNNGTIANCSIEVICSEVYHFLASLVPPSQLKLIDEQYGQILAEAYVEQHGRIISVQEYHDDHDEDDKVVNDNLHDSHNVSTDADKSFDHDGDHSTVNIGKTCSTQSHPSVIAPAQKMIIEDASISIDQHYQLNPTEHSSFVNITTTTLTAVETTTNDFTTSSTTTTTIQTDSIVKATATTPSTTTTTLLLPDLIVMSPPWGGPDYIHAPEYDLYTMLTSGCGLYLLMLAAAVCPNILFLIPINCSNAQIASIAHVINQPYIIEDISINHKAKVKAVYFGPIVENRTQSLQPAAVKPVVAAITNRYKKKKNKR